MTWEEGESRWRSRGVSVQGMPKPPPTPTSPSAGMRLRRSLLLHAPPLSSGFGERGSTLRTWEGIPNHHPFSYNLSPPAHPPPSHAPAVQRPSDRFVRPFPSSPVAAPVWRLTRPLHSGCFGDQFGGCCPAAHSHFYFFVPNISQRNTP